MVIGIEPGNTELGSGEAFSGLAGRRLMEWLRLAGLGDNREEVLKRAHLTSLCKCKVEKAPDRPIAARNCLPFLQAQIEILSPSIVLTLGAEPLRFLFDSPVPLESAVARSWKESDLSPNSLFPLFPLTTIIIPLPHPSPLSRWLNSAEARQLLEGAIARLRTEVS
jgi:uracil-DNA glycosylase